MFQAAARGVRVQCHPLYAWISVRKKKKNGCGAAARLTPNPDLLVTCSAVSIVPITCVCLHQAHVCRQPAPTPGPRSARGRRSDSQPLGRTYHEHLPSRDSYQAKSLWLSFFSSSFVGDSPTRERELEELSPALLAHGLNLSCSIQYGKRHERLELTLNSRCSPSASCH